MQPESEAGAWVTDGSEARRQRIARRDRLSSGTHISVELGPIATPDRALVVQRVRAIIGLGDAARVGRTIDGASWRYDPSALDAQAERIVRPLPDFYRGVGSLPRLREATELDLPFTIFLGPDRALLDMDHRLGDGFMAVMIVTAALVDGAMPQAFVGARDGDPLPGALTTTFARHPGRFFELLGSRLRQTRPPAYSGASVPAQVGSLDLATAVVSQNGFRALAAWTKGRASLSVAVLFALRAALAAEGIEVMDEGAVLVDLRRYLPSGRSTLSNFVVGHPMNLTPGVDAVGEQLHDDLRVGRPLAALSVGMAMGMIPRRQPQPAQAPTAAYPIVSDMGFLRSLERLPWTTDAPAAVVSVDPAARNGITALTSVMRRRLAVSLSFDSTLFDRGLVAAAGQRFAADPTGLLP